MDVVSIVRICNRVLAYFLISGASAVDAMLLLELLQPSWIVHRVQSWVLGTGDGSKVASLLSDSIVCDRGAFLLLFDDPGREGLFNIW